MAVQQGGQADLHPCLATVLPDMLPHKRAFAGGQVAALEGQAVGRRQGPLLPALHSADSRHPWSTFIPLQAHPLQVL